MGEFVSSFLVVVLGAAVATLQALRFRRWETFLLLTSFAAHIAAAFAQIWFTRSMYGGGDMFEYANFGELISAALRADFREFGPEVLKLLFHREPVLPVEVLGAGTSTGSMVAIAGFLSYFTNPSIAVLCLDVTVAAYFGKVALYEAFRSELPTQMHRRVAVAALLIPSAVFWSSALLKEAVATAGLGYVILGMVRLKRGPNVGAALMVVFGAVTVGLVKAYILFAVALAAGAWFYFQSNAARKGQFKPAYLLLGALVAAGGSALLGNLFPEYALENLGEQAARYQEIGQVSTGASTYAFGDPTHTTLAGQLAFAPLALFTSLFRPLIVEAKNPQILVNALETTAFLVLAIRAFAKHSVRETWRIISETPMLAFCLVFTFSFGIAVGLTTTNLGTLSRYRMPLIPFFAALLLVLDAVPGTKRVRDRPWAPASGNRRTAPH